METWQIVTGAVVAIAPWIVGCIYLMVRAPRQQTGVVSDPLTSVAVPAHQPMDVVLQTMAARLGVVEADTRMIATQLASVNELQARMVALEAAMPSIQTAYESYADQISRTDKRDTERVRRTEKVAEKQEALTAGEVAAEMTAIAGSEPVQANGQDMSEDELKVARARAGIVGSGGRGRRKTGA